MARIILFWGFWGPYHYCRLEALRNLGRREGYEVVGVSLFSGSRVNQWRSRSLSGGVVHYDLGRDETRLPLLRLGQLLRLPGKLRADVALLPSYFHWSLVLNAGTRLAGGRVVMMNETHGGTAKARGIKSLLKRCVVSRFDSALVGGLPQKRYFASLGIPPEKIFTGYDAVDNDYFALRAEEVRRQRGEVRRKYGLPEHYFLSLGRFVPKKNLATLIRAYRKVLDSSRNCRTHLVMVGSGEEDARLRSLCQELRLPAYDKTSAGAKTQTSGFEPELPGVHFYGFRQIEENPVFYALADAFILPSLWEEWGLVVNEAMACGLPVVVSETAGCAEDLLPPGRLAGPVQESVGSQERLAQLAGRIRQNGFVFNPESARSLADALMVLESVPALRENMGKASRVIIGSFSCDAFARNALLAARAANGEDVFQAPNFPPAEQPAGVVSDLAS